MVKSPKESHLDPNYLVSKVSHSPCFPTITWWKKPSMSKCLSQHFSIYVQFHSFPTVVPWFFTSFHIFPWDSTIFPPFFHKFPRFFPFPAGSPGGSPRASTAPPSPRRGGRRQRRSGDGASGGTRSGANPLLGKFWWMVSNINMIISLVSIIYYILLMI